MRFLADESCDFAVVRALRAAGHDVAAVAEFAHRADDSAVINLAVHEDRIVLTEDKDFGHLVYASAQETAGVILIRFPALVRKSLPAAAVLLVKTQKERLRRSFVVLQPGRARIGRV